MANSVNKVTLVGNLGKDPEVRNATSGLKIVNLTVATSDSWVDKSSGERKESTGTKERGTKHSPIPNRYTAFLQKVDTKSFDAKACWEWKGAGKGNGYGNVRVKTKNMTAHKRAYELFCGPVPDGMDVCHSCDNRWCVNPDHLFPGTRLENMTDCKAKGRTAGGNRKDLTEKTIQEIRRRAVAGIPTRRISEQLDVHYGTVYNVIKGKSYVSVGQ